jgi:hypothetical protein
VSQATQARHPHSGCCRCCHHRAPLFRLQPTHSCRPYQHPPQDSTQLALSGAGCSIFRPRTAQPCRISDPPREPWASPAAFCLSWEDKQRKTAPHKHTCRIVAAHPAPNRAELLPSSNGCSKPRFYAKPALKSSSVCRRARQDSLRRTPALKGSAEPTCVQCATALLHHTLHRDDCCSIACNGAVMDRACNRSQP